MPLCSEQRRIYSGEPHRPAKLGEHSTSSGSRFDEIDVAEWIGTPLSFVLESVGTLRQAKFVVCHIIEGKAFWESINMAEALHPQTFLAYGFNGGDLVWSNQSNESIRKRLGRDQEVACSVVCWFNLMR
jgi:DMSO/TMAO reductase YedYZ molybdopterin-dependent catalytic subunit